MNGQAAEVQLRTPLDVSRFEVSASPYENSAEVSALVHLAKALNQPDSQLNHQLNQWTPSESAIVSSDGANGNERSNDLVAKNLPEAPSAPLLKSVDVIDHYEIQQVPVFKTIQVEKPASDSGSAN